MACVAFTEDASILEYASVQLGLLIKGSKAVFGNNVASLLKYSKPRLNAERSFELSSSQSIPLILTELTVADCKEYNRRD